MVLGDPALGRVTGRAGSPARESPGLPETGRTTLELHQTIARLRAQVARDGREIMDGWAPRIRRCAYAASAENLARYIALRRQDLRGLQLELMPWGVSSLGRCEAQVLENLAAVEATLSRLSGSSAEMPHPSFSEPHRGQHLLAEHTEAALGPTPSGRHVRIMATLPATAAVDYELVRDLVARGMDIARINCAHDDPYAWAAVAAHVRRAATETGRPCRVCMDLCGPRSRVAAVIGGETQRLFVGEVLLLTAGVARDSSEDLPQVVCSLREAVEQIQIGQMVWIDEGRLGGIVERRAGSDAVLLHIVEAPAKGAPLREAKGLNFPDTELRLTPLTSKDLIDLDVAVAIADMIGYSFVQRADDIATLQEALAKRLDAPATLALVAKIETATAVCNLPELIVQGAGVQPLAVMIARGDLAVEIGHRRLVEMQEEILWLCEVAHVPVIWATQVLDAFVKKGRRSRAENTDAAMAERAECVMLNRGPFAADAIAFLDDVLGRMEGHQYKKAARMRALRAW